GLLQDLLQAQGGKLVREMAGNFNLDEAGVGKALGALVPALGAGVQRNVSNAGGLEALAGALKSGHHQRYIDEPERVGASDTVADGNAILGHLFGSKEVSREVAARAAQKSGVGTDTLKKMLPVVAAMVMGTMSKQTSGGNALAGQGGGSPLGGVLSALAGGQGGQGGTSSALTSMLDADGDGSMVDDVLGMLMPR
ncbi:MAG: DUF937 domain-containing protein, partial [Gammaproteobacteria bacterium]|nr:DUF937 domain-containing protein [Gammaproteobacteria bacterium]